jgi:hypothetical protein
MFGVLDTGPELLNPILGDGRIADDVYDSIYVDRVARRTGRKAPQKHIVKSLQSINQRAIGPDVCAMREPRKGIQAPEEVAEVVEGIVGSLSRNEGQPAPKRLRIGVGDDQVVEPAIQVVVEKPG